MKFSTETNKIHMYLTFKQAESPNDLSLFLFADKSIINFVQKILN